MRPLARALALAALAVGLGPAGSAAGQALPPSLTADTNYAFAGIVEYDFLSIDSPDVPYAAGVDPARGRHYAVGATALGGDEGVAVVARRTTGALDPTFDGDGTLALDLIAGVAEHATSIAVLPDGRLRIAGVGETLGGNTVVAVGGLLADGSSDPGFGVGGIVLLDEVDPDTEDPSPAIVAGADGRLAITGTTGPPGAQDTFVAVLEPDGAPADFGTDGMVVRDVAGGLDDGGVDVAWGARGPVALVEESGAGPAGDRAVLRAFTDAGDDDAGFNATGEVTLESVGPVGTAAGGLVAYGGRLWATGAVTGNVDVDAYVARVDANGAGLEVRRFDMRGAVFPASQQVDSVGADVAVATGEPDTLVVVGSAETDTGKEVGVAAFNLLDGPVAAMQMAELVIAAAGQVDAVGVAAGDDAAPALAVSHENFSKETMSGSHDFSIGMSRVLIDDEKRCDLGLSVVAPLELTMRGVAPSNVTLRATNGGQRACGGTITVPAPYATTPAALPTGKLGPGRSVDLTASIAYGAALPADDTLTFSLAAPGDAALGDNVARLHVLFSFCDLQLRRVGAPRVLGFEGALRYDFTVRNSGTADCTRASIAVGGSGRRALATERYTVPPGQSVTDEVMVAVRRRMVRPGARAAISFAVSATDDVQAANDVQAHRPLVVRVGDTSARRPERGSRLFTGTAKPARRVPGVKRSARRVARVEIAVRRVGKGCRWMATRAGGLRIVPRGLGGACDRPVWIRVDGTDDWRLRIRRALPAGRYTLISRAVTRNGAVEGAYSFKDRNKLRFRVE